MRLKGRVALVTGSSSGIGRATAITLAREGADVAVNGRNQARIAQVVNEVEAQNGRRAIGISADVGSYSESQAMVDRVVREFGHLDILVTTPTAFKMKPFLDTTEQDWDSIIAVDLKGIFNCAHAAIPHMLRDKWGRLIAVTAVAGIVGHPKMSAINAAKHGAHGLLRCLALEFASSGITINAVAPGPVDTPLLASTPEELRGLTPPIGRIGKPEEVAQAILYFALDEAGFTTGQILNISGGLAI